MDGLALYQVECECVLGVFAAERSAPQVVRWNLDLSVDTKRAGVSGQLQHTVDYVNVTRDVTRLLRFRRYQLLETAVEELAGMLLACYPQVEQLRLELVKPAALPEPSRGAAVRVTRTRVDYPTTKSAENGVTRVDMLRTFEATLSVLTLDPGARWCTAASPSVTWVTSAERGVPGTGATTPDEVLGEAAVVLNSTHAPLVLFQCSMSKP